MRVDNIEEESKVGEPGCDETSMVKFINKSENMFEENGKTMKFLGAFRRGFLQQSTREDRRKKMHEEILLGSSIASEIEDVKELHDY